MRTRIFTALRFALLLSLFLVTFAVQAQEPVLQEAPARPAQLEPPPPRTGFVPPPVDLSHLTGQRMPARFLHQRQPGSWDWRAQGKVTPVKDQGACGSCYAFASVGNVESKLLMDGAGTYDLSENNAKECNWWETAGAGGGSCDGGSYEMLVNLFSKKGTVLESCDPYVPNDVACESTCPYQQTLLDWRIISGDAVPSTEVLKSYIYNYGPIYTTIYASFPGFSAYDGSYTLYYPGTERPNHAVLIVGWDDSLSHAGGTGGWIVKNSWGTDWGGPCGYGAEGGYFTIAYGSANIGMYSSFVYDWQDYDTSGEVLYYDEAGWTTGWGYSGSTTAWGLVKFIPTHDMTVTRVEFWTTDATTDVDVYVYDDFDGTALSNLLAQKLNNSFDEAGYHSVALDSPVGVSSGDDVIAVVKFTNASNGYPVPADWYGPGETGRTYISGDGSSGSWTDLGSYAGDDIAIRLRTVAGSSGGSWTFLVYLDGDNNLEDAAIDDFLEMASVGSNGNVNIAVQLDRIPGYDSRYGDWTSAKRFLVAPGMTPTSANAIQDIGEANMGDPQTLVDFAQWGMSNYPADHYALVIWDHGSGWRLGPEKRPPVKDIAYDDTSGGDALDMPELRSVMDTLSGGGSEPLDLVGFDACLMGMIEVDDQLIPFVEVRVGSEETEPWGGWPYDNILSALTANPAMPAGQLGTVIVDEYYASYGNGETQSAVDLGAAYSDLVGAVDDFAVALIDSGPTYCSEMAIARSRTQMFYYTTYVDLYDFAYQINQQVSDATINAAATNVMNAVDNTVIREQHGSSWPGAHGISIYFPEFEGGYDTTYDGSQGWLQFTANTQWDEWLHAFYDCPTTCNDPHEPNDNRADATPINYDDTLSADICPAGDVDYYVFSGSADDVIVADIDAQSLSPASALDSYLYLLDSDGNELAYNDDHDGLDSRIEYTLPADGTYYLRVEEYNHPYEGGPGYFYTISLALAPPPFDVNSNHTSNPPSIDGHISAGEWSDAASYDITALGALVRLEGEDIDLAIVGPSRQSRLRPSSSPVTLYVMNDGSHLYLAFDNPNDTVYHDFDQIGIYFDDNPLPSDGQWTNTTCGHADGEGNFWVLNSTPEFREIIAGPDYCDSVEPAPGVDGSLQFTSGYAQAEVAIDLTGSALRASPGDSVNMYLWIYDHDTGTMDGVWPIGSVWNDPSTYRPLTLATGGGSTTVRIEPATSSVSPGDDFTISVMIDDVVDLGAYDFHMDFDPSIVHVVSVEDGGFLGSTGLTVIPLGPDIDNVAGTVAFGAITVGSGQGPDGTGALATISLNAVDSGISDLDLHDVSVFDTEGNVQAVVAQDGTVVVAGGGDTVIVTIGDGNGAPGSTDNPVTVSADNQSQNPTPIAAGEFQIVYDGSIGLTLADVNTTTRSTDFSVGWSLDETNPSAAEAHILLYSLSGATIAPGTGPILELLFDVDAAAQAGDSSALSFSAVSLANQQGYAIPVDFTDTGQFTLGCAKDGDINDDGDTNIFDLLIQVNMILHSPQPDPSLYSLDWWCRGDLAPPPNGDGQWNIFDLQRLVCIILGTCENGRGEETGARGENVVSIEEVYAEPGTSGAFDVDCDNVEAISAVEVRFTYDSAIGLDVSNVATTSRTDGWTVAFSEDEGNPSAVEVHVLLYNVSGWAIETGTGAILVVEYDVDAGGFGVSPLGVTQGNLSDAQAQPVRAKWQDGTFHIVGPYRIYLPLVIR